MNLDFDANLHLRNTNTIHTGFSWLDLGLSTTITTRTRPPRRSARPRPQFNVIPPLLAGPARAMKCENSPSIISAQFIRGDVKHSTQMPPLSLRQYAVSGSMSKRLECDTLSAIKVSVSKVLSYPWIGTHTYHTLLSGKCEILTV